MTILKEKSLTVESIHTNKNTSQTEPVSSLPYNTFSTGANTKLDLGTGFITNAGTPTTGQTTRLANVQFVLDQIALAATTGGQMKEAVLCAGQLDNTEGILPAFGFYITGSIGAAHAGTIIGFDSSATAAITFKETATPSVDGDWSKVNGNAVTSMTNLVTAMNAHPTFSAAYVADFRPQPELNTIGAGAGVIVIYAKAQATTQMRIWATINTSNIFQVISYIAEANYEYPNANFLAAATSDPGVAGYQGFSRDVASLLEPEVHATLAENSWHSWDTDDQVWNFMASFSHGIPFGNDGTPGIVAPKEKQFTVNQTTGELIINLGDGLIESPSEDYVQVDLEAPGAGTGGLEFNGLGIGLKKIKVSTDEARGLSLTDNGLGLDIGTDTGLLFNANALEVAPGDGIALSANGVDADLEAVATGSLEFSGSSPNKKIRAAVEAAGVGVGGLKRNATGLALNFEAAGVATGGISLTANGAAVLVDGTTVTKSASGLSANRAALSPKNHVITLTGTDITNQWVALPAAALSANSVWVVPLGGVAQELGVDFTISGILVTDFDKLAFGTTAGLFSNPSANGLSSLLASGDKILVFYAHA